eukprot:20344_1
MLTRLQMVKPNKLMFYIIIHCIDHSSSLTTLSFTANETVPSNITYVSCNDPTGCDISCGIGSMEEGVGCQGITINASHAGYLILRTTGAWTFRGSNIYCPQNAQCTIDTGSGANYAALIDSTIHCGANGTCDIFAGSGRTLSGVNIYAQTSTKLTITADDAQDVINGGTNVYCPKNKPPPSCIIKLKTDPARLTMPDSDWIQAVVSSTRFYVNNISDLEFQCDANSKWTKLFTTNPGYPNYIFHYNGYSPQCQFYLNFSADDFFGTNALRCYGQQNSILDGKQCLPRRPITDAPTTHPTHFPIQTLSPTITLQTLPLTDTNSSIITTLFSRHVQTKQPWVSTSAFVTFVVGISTTLCCTCVVILVIWLVKRFRNNILNVLVAMLEKDEDENVNEDLEEPDSEGVTEEGNKEQPVHENNTVVYDMKATEQHSDKKRKPNSSLLVTCEGPTNNTHNITAMDNENEYGQDDNNNADNFDHMFVQGEHSVSKSDQNKALPSPQETTETTKDQKESIFHGTKGEYYDEYNHQIYRKRAAKVMVDNR